MSRALLQGATMAASQSWDLNLQPIQKKQSGSAVRVTDIKLSKKRVKEGARSKTKSLRATLP